MADLFWLPYDVAEWEERTRELSLEQEGALMRLLRHAWRDPDPCTIADSDAAFDRALGSRWKKMMPLVRQHFTPVEGKPGRLRCEWLFALYQQQLAKHESYKERGKLGGRPKAPPKHPQKAQDKPQPKVELKAEVSTEHSQSSSEGNSSGSLRSHRAIPPSPDGALALEAPRAAGEEPSTEPGVVSATDLQAAEAWLATRPDVEAEIERELGDRTIDLADVRAFSVAPRERIAQGRLGLAMRRYQRVGLLMARYRGRDTEAHA